MNNVITSNPDDNRAAVLDDHTAAWGHTNHIGLPALVCRPASQAGARAELCKAAARPRALCAGQPLDLWSCARGGMATGATAHTEIALWSKTTGAALWYGTAGATH